MFFKMKKNLLPESISGLAYILLLCVVCHGMLLLNDGFFWDDNLYYGLIQGKHYAELSTFLLETGLPINILFFRGLDLLFGISNHRVVGFFTIFLSAVLLNSLFRRYAGDFRSLSLVFTSLYLALFPFKSTVLLCTLVYQVMLLFFMTAVYVRVSWAQHNSQLVRISALAIFLLLSFVSFNTASILVLFYFFLACEYFSSINFSLANLSFHSAWNFVKRNVPALLLPIIYWVGKSIFFPTHGLYKNYNKVIFDLSRQWDVVVAFFNGIFSRGPLHDIEVRYPMVSMGILLACLILAVFPRIWIVGRFHLPSTKRPKPVLLLLSIVFLVVSALPYILIGEGPRYQGWESRHYILFTLSLPLFILALVVIYIDRLKAISEIKFIDYIFRPLIAGIVLVGVVSANIVYLDYQLIAIKQWAVVENLKIKPELKSYSVFAIDDQVGDFSQSEFSWYQANYQAFYEWAAIFKKAWGGEKWYGNNINRPEEFYKSMRYGTADIDPDGRKCLLTLSNTSPYGRIGIARRYFKVKYFGTDSQLKEFLLSIVAIESCQSNGVRTP